MFTNTHPTELSVYYQNQRPACFHSSAHSNTNSDIKRRALTQKLKSVLMKCGIIQNAGIIFHVWTNLVFITNCGFNNSTYCPSPSFLCRSRKLFSSSPSQSHSVCALSKNYLRRSSSVRSCALISKELLDY